MEFYVARVSLFDPLAMAVAFVAPASRALTGPAIPGLALPITGRTWRPPVGAQSPAGGATEPIVGKDYGTAEGRTLATPDDLSVRVPTGETL